MTFYLAERRFCRNNSISCVKYAGTAEASRLNVHHGLKTAIMKNHPISAELKELLDTRDELCVSVIIPMNEIPSMRKLDKITIDHAIDKLQKILEQDHSVNVVSEFITRFRSLESDLMSISGVKGVGIFASKSVFRIITFPFEVQEKIYAGDSFEVRDVLYRDQFSVPYKVIALTLDRVRLFSGTGGTLTEVVDSHFPATLSEPEQEIPGYSGGSANLAAATKREMILTMESRQAFLKAVDKKFQMYVQHGEPVFVAGVEKEVAAFESLTVHRERIRGRIPGSYNGYNHNELALKSWHCMQQFMQDEETILITSLNELFGKELVSIGLPDVWRNAKLGKGSMLVVEKDLAQPAFLTGDGFQLWTSAPAEEHQLLSDAIDDLIEVVLSMDGKVHFVENGKLKEFNGVAMVHRY